VVFKASDAMATKSNLSKQRRFIWFPLPEEIVRMKMRAPS